MSLFGKARVETTDIEKRFNLIGRVGQGSMSKVWRAEDKMSGHFVAIKVLDKEKTKRFEDRFKGLKKPSEAEISLSLNHPYIVKTLEVGWTLEEEMFLVMDYVEGSGLGLLVDLQSGEMTRYRTRYLIQIGEALAYFHQQGYIHRDICPRNIMVTDDHKIRLIDFGLTVPSTPDFCKPGNRTGTANYMAPELIKRRPTDQRIDVFSYSVTCYEMYAKRHPWDAAQTLDAVMQHINKPPVDLLELVPRMDRQIAETIMKGLAMDANDRWQTVEDMIKEFRAAEVRLVTATKALLTKRKRVAAGHDGADSPAATGKPRATQQKPNKPTPEKAAPAKPKVPQQAAAKPAAKPAVGKKPVAKAVAKPAAKAAAGLDDSADDILAAGVNAAEQVAKAKAKTKTKAKVDVKATASVVPVAKKKPQGLKLPPAPAALAASTPDRSDQSDDDILALPDD